MKFTYTAKRDGQTYQGSVDAPDRFEVYRRIRAEGGEVVTVVSEAMEKWSFAYWNAKLSTVKEHEIIILAGNLSAMTNAGLALTRALTVAEKQTKSPRLKQVIGIIRGDIQKGGTFNGALEQFPNIFSKLFISMVRAGEESGNLGDALSAVRDQLSNAAELKKKIKGALIYPSIILVAIVIVGFLMMTEVVPTLASTFEELHAELPASTKAILATSNFLVEYTLLAAGGFVFFVLAIYAGLRTPQGRRLRDRVLLALPIIGELVREIQAARTARTLASLLSSGVDVVTALGITKDVVQNIFHKEIIDQAVNEVKKGGQLSHAFSVAENLYPPLLGALLAVGEETGAMADMLGQVADFYESEVAQKTENMTTIIEPFLMIIVGGVVGFFAISMISPIYSLSDAF